MLDKTLLFPLLCPVVCKQKLWGVTIIFYQNGPDRANTDQSKAKQLRRYRPKPIKRSAFDHIETVAYRTSSIAEPISIRIQTPPDEQRIKNRATWRKPPKPTREIIRHYHQISATHPNAATILADSSFIGCGEASQFMHLLQQQPPAYLSIADGNKSHEIAFPSYTE